MRDLWHPYLHAPSAPSKNRQAKLTARWPRALQRSLSSKQTASLGARRSTHEPQGYPPNTLKMTWLLLNLWIGLMQIATREFCMYNVNTSSRGKCVSLYLYIYIYVCVQTCECDDSKQAPKLHSPRAHRTKPKLAGKYSRSSESKRVPKALRVQVHYNEDSGP